MESMANDNGIQDKVVSFLSEPRSYGPDVHLVERHETHGAIVFLAGDRAYKLKRAVKFPYMDYSTAELRRQMCARELAVNRRTAPNLYLEVRPIVCDDRALRFGSSAESRKAVDWVVVMRRFEQGALLENLRQSDGLTVQLMRLVGETVARFHAEAEVERDLGGEAGIRAVIAGNAEVLSSTLGRPFSAEAIAQYESRALKALANVAELLENRRQQGHVRRCHGDLHLNNICLLGKVPVLFDAIEFSDRFSCIDVLYDLAFLVMDLDRHGSRALANSVFNRYLELSSEHTGLSALPLFLSCRAAVRSHTAIARAETHKDDALQPSLLRDAAALLDLAVVYLARTTPRLIAIGGLSGTGKSTLAHALAPLLGMAPGAVVIRSDVVRKQLMGVPESFRLPETAYTREASEHVYKRVAEISADTLGSGYTVIADAVYGTENERQEIAQVAQHWGVEFSGLWLEGPAALLERRITVRRDDASDATPDVLRAQLGFATVPQTWTTIDAGISLDYSLTQARRTLGD
jgi:aminoglycoside phosphotransferase family enzyme/predicted kinase